MRRERRVLHRWARLGAAVVALIGGSGLMVTEAFALLSAGPTVEVPTLELSDDDAAAALFTASDMAPGSRVTGCIAVRHDADGPVALRLFGETTGSGLERALRLLVEAGRGGRFGDCSGFVGAAVYDGTLDGFARDHGEAASGVAVAVDTVDEAVAFRFTVEMLDDNRAQGTDAGATFTWQAEGTPAATGVPTLPFVVDAPAAAPDASAGTASQSIAAPATAGEEEAVAAPSGSPRSRGRLEPLDAEGGDSLVARLVRGARYLAERAVFPAGLLILAGAFLLVQDFIDRRDPKLALAPIHPDPDLSFDP